LALFGLFKSDPLKDAAYQMYRVAGERARDERYFIDLQVTDSFDGRFDVLVIHVHLLIRRLRALPPRDAKKAQQHFFDVFIGDMDQGLRISGVGDIGIGHRVKKMTHAYYGRAVAYDEALDAGDSGALRAALVRNLYREQPVDPLSVDTVTAYMKAQDQRLAGLSDEQVLAGKDLFERIEGPET